MGLAYATRAPTSEEDVVLKLLLSTYRDGTGTERELDQSTRPSWRQIERCVAELVNAVGGEDKGVFDVVARDSVNPDLAHGFSVKSKQLSQADFSRLGTGARVYMEIANSPALFWAAIQAAHGFSEVDFRKRLHANEIGSTVLATVAAWHVAAKVNFERRFRGVTLDLATSKYLCISYSKNQPDERQWQAHAFSLHYPEGLQWEYKSDSCLSACDPQQPTEKLFDWYGVSGGQLKYYPRGTSAIYSSSVFKLRKPTTVLTIRDKAKAYFSDEYP